MVFPDPKFLIIGANGYLGSYLYQNLKEMYPDTLGTSHRQSHGLAYFDLNSPSLSFLSKIEASYTHAIICAAIPNILKCEQNPKETFLQNVLGTLNLIRELNDKKIKSIVFSSDVVFDGKDAIYTEDSPPNPLNEYGRQKKILEDLAFKICPDLLLIRLSKIYSISHKDNTMLFDLGSRLLSGQSIKAASDLFFNPICIDDVYSGLLTLIKNNRSGLYHLSSPQTTSWYQLATQLAKQLNCSPNLIDKISIDQLSPNTLRAKKLNMQPKKLTQEFPDFKFTLQTTSIAKVKENLLLSAGSL